MRIEELFDGIRHTIELLFMRLPADRQQIEKLLRLAGYLNEASEYVFKLDLADYDDPREICLAWQGDGYRMILAFPMEESGLPNPLVLSGEGLTYSEVSEIVKGVCLDGRETDSFPLIMERFHDVTSELYGDSSADISENEKAE